MSPMELREYAQKDLELRTAIERDTSALNRLRFNAIVNDGFTYADYAKVAGISDTVVRMSVEAVQFEAMGDSTGEANVKANVSAERLAALETIAEREGKSINTVRTSHRTEVEDLTNALQREGKAKTLTAGQKQDAANARKEEAQELARFYAISKPVDRAREQLIKAEDLLRDMTPDEFAKAKLDHLPRELNLLIEDAQNLRNSVQERLAQLASA